MKDKCFEVAKHFLDCITHDGFELRAIKTGLINETYKLTFKGEDFILQKVNHHIFKNPDLIHQNYKIIKEHLLKLDYPKESISFLSTTDGENLVLIVGEYWRMSKLIAGVTHQVNKSIDRAVVSAKHLAEFHYYLKDIDISKIKNPIPGFCDFSSRLVDFNTAVQHGPKERLEMAKQLIQEIQDNLYLIDRYIEVVKRIPSRIIHADPKISNLIFVPEGDEVVAIIDIDTIMMGTVLYDFGDMVRSFANRSTEDAVVGNNCFNPDIYDSLHRGYLEVGDSFLSEEERKNLPLASLCVSLMQSIRFLTDYLTMDKYYHTTSRDQNHHRAVNQFTYFQEIKDYLEPRL